MTGQEQRHGRPDAGRCQVSAALTLPTRHRGRRRPVPWLAWSLWLVVMAVNVLTFVLFTVPDDTQSATTLFGTVIGRIPFMAFATVGALILSRRPSNVIGWLCWAIGLTVSLSDFGSVSAARSIGTDPDRLFAGLVLYQLGQVMFLLPLLGLLPLLVLLFPTGRLPSRRWWPLVWAFAAGLVLFAASVLFKPGPLDHGLPFNPLGLESAKGLLQLAGTVSTLMFPMFVVLVLISLVLRFRRTRGDERQQLKWFMFAAALLVVFGGGLGGIAERVRSPYVGPVLFVIVVSMIPVAIGVAVLRYRLYDIDRIINRTLVYGVLTGVLGLGYAAAVLVLGQLFGGVGERTPSWAVAGATLAMAALFQPARRRIQQAVDRHFNRRKYDTAKTIQAFSIHLRDQIDLDTLSTELLEVIDQTMEPTRVSLWLRPSPPGSSGIPRSQARPGRWVY
jgi:hypothetical protein